jgi:hypothetical protein
VDQGAICSMETWVKLVHHATVFSMVTLFLCMYQPITAHYFSATQDFDDVPVSECPNPLQK